MHGQGTRPVSAVEAGVPTKGTRVHWTEVADNDGNPVRRMHATAYWIREGELSENTKRILSDLAVTGEEDSCWRSSAIYKSFGKREKEFQHKTLGRPLRDFVAANVSTHDFKANLFNLKREVILCLLYSFAIFILGIVVGNLEPTRILLIDAAWFTFVFFRQIALAEEEFEYLVCGSLGGQQHFADLKTHFARTILFSELDDIWDITTVPVRRMLYYGLSRDDKLDFWIARWTWPLMYNMYEWAKGFVMLEACFKSDKIGTILKSAFCSFANSLWYSVCRPALENELIRMHESSRFIRQRYTLPESPYTPYAAYRQTIAKDFPILDPTNADTAEPHAFGSVEEVWMTRAQEVWAASARKRCAENIKGLRATKPS